MCLGVSSSQAAGPLYRTSVWCVCVLCVIDVFRGEQYSGWLSSIQDQCVMCVFCVWQMCLGVSSTQADGPLHQTLCDRCMFLMTRVCRWAVLRQVVHCTGPVCDRCMLCTTPVCGWAVLRSTTQDQCVTGVSCVWHMLVDEQYYTGPVCVLCVTDVFAGEQGPVRCIWCVYNVCDRCVCGWAVLRLQARPQACHPLHRAGVSALRSLVWACHRTLCSHRLEQRYVSLCVPCQCLLWCVAQCVGLFVHVFVCKCACQFVGVLVSLFVYKSICYCVGYFSLKVCLSVC